MIAVPPWKAEYLEKKRKKERKDEIPLWKRDLIKRIQSKHKSKMAEEDQKEIVEEHIPRVSDNIFLVHEKQQHRTLPNSPLATSKLSHPEPLPSSATPVPAIENVIIIEKDSDEQPLPTPAKDDAEQKEFPKTGIVHRLMGRFQIAKAAKKTSSYHVPPYQRSQSVEAIDTATEKEEAHSTDSNVPSAQVTSSSVSDIHPRTYSMPNDVMTPLLLSSAKPFIKQSGPPKFIHVTAHSNTAEKNIPGYHHVTSPKQKNFTNSLTRIQVTNNESPAENDEKIIEKPKIPDEMCNLHGIKSPNAEPTNHIIRKTDTSLPRSIPPAKSGNKALVNGDSLHSSGNVSNTTPATVNLVGHGTRLQDKSNFPSYGSTNKNDCAPQKKEVTSVQLNKTNEVKSKPHTAVQSEDDSSSKASDAKENRNQLSRTTKLHKSLGFKTEDVNKTKDESTLKTPGKYAPNNSMMVSKGVKITSKKVEIQNKIIQKHVTTSAKTSESVQKPTGATEKPSSKSHIEYTQYSKKTAPVNSNQLPSTCIDDVINETQSKPIVITAVDSLPVSTVSNAKTYRKPEEAKTEKLSVVTNTSSATSAKQNFVSKKPTSPLLQKKPISSPILKPKLSSSARFGSTGKSFQIDPSKFKRSSAPRTSSSATAQVNNSTSACRNVRQVTPQQDKSTDQADTVSGGVPKAGKRKLTVDQITVIGGYVSLDRSCLVKNNKRKKNGAVISFDAVNLETTYTYESERSLLMENTVTVAGNPLAKAPGFGKESSIGKYTPKYLLSMKNKILDDEEETDEKSSTTPTENILDKLVSNDATPLSDESASTWSQTTESTDILF